MEPAFERALQKIQLQLRERPGARFTIIIILKPNRSESPLKRIAEPRGEIPLNTLYDKAHSYGFFVVIRFLASIILTYILFKQFPAIPDAPNVVEVFVGVFGVLCYLTKSLPE